MGGTLLQVNNLASYPILRSEFTNLTSGQHLECHFVVGGPMSGKMYRGEGAGTDLAINLEANVRGLLLRQEAGHFTDLTRSGAGGGSGTRGRRNGLICSGAKATD